MGARLLFLVLPRSRSLASAPTPVSLCRADTTPPSSSLSPSLPCLENEPQSGVCFVRPNTHLPTKDEMMPTTLLWAWCVWWACVETKQKDQGGFPKIYCKILQLYCTYVCGWHCLTHIQKYIQRADTACNSSEELLLQDTICMACTEYQITAMRSEWEGGRSGLSVGLQGSRHHTSCASSISMERLRKHESSQVRQLLANRQAATTMNESSTRVLCPLSFSLTALLASTHASKRRVLDDCRIYRIYVRIFGRYLRDDVHTTYMQIYSTARKSLHATLTTGTPS